ncbi:hypothetical protein GOODEAATRI_020901 [Goodea atripinnis]|uniref:Uncharacterized protein n=1 Tax=Goodea atripinnis TaxID=208336 RepID=A0ABV0PR22_9TELE
MLDSILSQHEAIMTLLVDTVQYDRIAQINVDNLKTLVAFLKVFKDATNDLESDNSAPSASLVLSWSITLIEHCQAEAQDHLLSEVAKVCISCLQELMNSNTTSLHIMHKKQPY